MRLLLDTHAVIWFVGGSRHLGSRARAAIEDVSNEKCVSVATIWEIAIKTAIGKLTVAGDARGRIVNAGFRELDITGDHAVLAGGLPRLHPDPFDRMLVAQAQLEGLTIVTSDPMIERYQVAVLPAS